MVTKAQNWLVVSLLGLMMLTFSWGFSPICKAEETVKPGSVTPAASSETRLEVEDIGSPSIFSRAWHAGAVVFMVLTILVVFSIMSWAILVWKMIVLRKNTKSSDIFIKSFWDSRSLNDLNSRLADYAPSPAKEVFRTGYAELVRGSQLKESLPNSQLAITAAMENINRSLSKAKRIERKKLESFLPLLATIASAAPFIGLFGKVWGIMGSFEGIARSGSASLAAVAPGISEALIATAFGLAAAIPAVVAFNTANSKIRGLVGSLDGFTMDFLNIVGRYLVSDRKGTGSTNAQI